MEAGPLQPKSPLVTTLLSAPIPGGIADLLGHLMKLGGPKLLLGVSPKHCLTHLLLATQP